jgi:hypothetical protein
MSTTNLAAASRAVGAACGLAVLLAGGLAHHAAAATDGASAGPKVAQQQRDDLSASPTPTGSACAPAAVQGYRFTVHIPSYPIALAVSERTGHVFALGEGIDPVSGCQDSNTGVVSMLNARTGKLLHSVSIDAPALFGTTDDAANRLLLVAMSGPAGAFRAGHVVLIDTHSGVIVAQSARKQCPCGLAVSPTTGRAFFSFNGGIQVLDARTGAALGLVRLSGGASLAVDDQRQRVYAAGGVVSVLDGSSGRLLHTFAVPHCAGQPGMQGVGVDSRLGRLYTASAGTTTDRYNQATNSPGYFCVIDSRTGRLVSRQNEGNGTSARILTVDEVAHVVLVGTEGYAGGSAAAVVDGANGHILTDTTAWLDPATTPAVDPRTGNIFAASHATGLGGGLVRRIQARLRRASVVARGVHFPWAIAVAAHARRVFLADSESTTVTVLCADSR